MRSTVMTCCQQCARSGPVFHWQNYRRLAAKCPAIREVRGLGLMIGVDLTLEARPAVLKLAEHGLISSRRGRMSSFFTPVEHHARGSG